MKVLLVSNAVVGGAGKACLRLCHALNKQGNIEARILILEGKSDPLNSVWFLYNSVSQLYLKQLYSTPIRIWYQIRFGTRKSKLRVPKSIHPVQNHELIDWADVINLHWVTDFVDYHTFFKRVNKPIVWTMHDMLPFSGGYHYEMEKEKGFEKLEDTIEKYKAKSLSKAKLAIIAPSKWLVDISEQQRVFKGRFHRQIFNTLDLGLYKLLDKYVARTALSLPEKKRIILFSADGISNPRKGFDILQDALMLLDLRDVHLLIVGRGSLSLPDGVKATMLGHIGDEISMSIAYNASDISVIPSREDNMPNAIVESLACGCAVVALPAGGIPELVINGQTGFLSASFEPRDLAEAIRKGLDYEFNRTDLREQIFSRLNEDRIAREYIETYNLVIESV